MDPAAKVSKATTVRQLTEAELEHNFELFNALLEPKLKFPLTEESRQALSSATTTHAFGSRAGGESRLYRKILFEDGGLKSNRSRRSTSRDLLASVPDLAKSVGLDEYVFTYLGIHDPYYARTHFPAFGIFVSKSAEKHPQSNASSRDLSSPEFAAFVKTLTPDEILLHFYLPDRGRQLAAREFQTDAHDHGGDFKKYWGSPELWEGDYARDHWKWMFEFHFLDNIPCSEFDAVLWPLETHYNPWTRGRIPSKASEDRSNFAKQHPSCTIISYPSSFAKPGLGFIYASWQAIGHYLQHGIFPSTVPGLP
jgi:hypothetical protein